MRLFAVFLLCTAISTSGCSLFTVKSSERYRKECTHSYFGPALDVAGTLLFTLGGIGASSAHNAPHSEGTLDVTSGNDGVLGAGVISTVFGLVFAVSAIKGFKTVEGCNTAYPQAD